ncbi:MAG: hypothetical protein WCG93_15815 [Paludibacter sp.]
MYYFFRVNAMFIFHIFIYAIHGLKSINAISFHAIHGLKSMATISVVPLALEEVR